MLCVLFIIFLFTFVLFFLSHSIIISHRIPHSFICRMWCFFPLRRRMWIYSHSDTCMCTQRECSYHLRLFHARSSLIRRVHLIICARLDAAQIYNLISHFDQTAALCHSTTMTTYLCSAANIIISISRCLHLDTL